MDFSDPRVLGPQGREQERSKEHNFLSYLGLSRAPGLTASSQSPFEIMSILGKISPRGGISRETAQVQCSTML